MRWRPPARDKPPFFDTHRIRPIPNVPVTSRSLLLSILSHRSPNSRHKPPRLNQLARRPSNPSTRHRNGSSGVRYTQFMDHATMRSAAPPPVRFEDGLGARHDRVDASGKESLEVLALRDELT